MGPPSLVFKDSKNAHLYHFYEEWATMTDHSEGVLWVIRPQYE